MLSRAAEPLFCAVAINGSGRMRLPRTIVSKPAGRL